MVKKISLVVLVAIAAFSIYNRERITCLLKEDTRTINTAEVKLLFREDPTIDQLTSRLIERGILPDPNHFNEYVAANGIDASQFAGGKYIVLSQTQLPALVRGFIKGENGHGNAELKVNVDFNRCKDLRDIASNISKCIIADSASIASYLLSSDTESKYGFTTEQMPALFLPERYKMYFDTDAETFTRLMADEFNSFWNEERKGKMKSVGLNSPSQVATVASIVYSEQSKMESEWPIIAKLYLNRIKKGMRLESDPTFKFCWGDQLDGVERLLNRHKEIDCPYNTYKYSGLPPGPIFVVPRGVIDAVLNPSNVDYIFMCGKPGGGGHNFAVTNREHEQNAALYRVWLKRYLTEKNR
ncbi:MAG: endolytic transglycosylase MltG [Crocinitomicaceae bacterium]|nr:endolytic transglycosylase MltG [Crocinitomicaceae bacterium]MDG1777592.1 endolytic transglycosylase MltG [Crocinitomicaceae bacterium]